MTKSRNPRSNVLCACVCVRACVSKDEDRTHSAMLGYLLAQGVVAPTPLHSGETAPNTLAACADGL
jgi:hypothetical protein